MYINLIHPSTLEFKAYITFIFFKSTIGYVITFFEVYTLIKNNCKITLN